MSLTAYGRHILDRIPADAALVVHYGTDPELAQAFARINPDAVWLPWSAAADLAPRSAGAVLINGDMPAGADGDAILARAVELLAEGAMLLAVAHSADFHGVRAAEMAGIPVSPGLRRPEAMIATVEGAGATMCQVISLENDTAGAKAFAEAHPDTMTEVPPDLRVARLGSRRFLLEATRGPLPTPMFIYARMRDAKVGANGAMAEVRVARPLRFLSAIPNVRMVPEYDPTPMRPPQRPRAIFLYQRPILRRPPGIELLRALIQRQYLVVMEFDDHPSYWADIAEHDYLTFAGAHAVQTSTEPLAQVLRQYNPYVGVFRNDAAELPPRRAPRPPPSAEHPLRIFYGSLNRADSMRPLIDGINRLLRRTKVPIHFTVLADERFHDQLATRRKDYSAMVDHVRHRQMVDEADIVLLPLADTEFNRCKSDLSFVEASARGAVVLANPVVYGPSIVDGVTGMLFTTPEEFEAKLALLVENGALRQRLAANAHHYVRSQRMQKNQFRSRWQWYQSLLDRKEELDRAVRERIPEFRDL
ncbi:glycosyltransferase involved in cell wall biosynthesis [Stella humosa]|uniref:Glycosyltransferase involved in cell wall biosynthesis n=1 Tax=Stella humosa TaxID=94 RepID=A0A3N1MDI5_9PROT|nr:glycosyltransferase [Stella humosa]ROQ01608.1 glycosyltransferase involved in cell wall biosynthesis [Stella humosa]BBK31989.1 hypothetical protein STHU_26230 [Stella humosa]